MIDSYPSDIKTTEEQEQCLVLSKFQNKQQSNENESTASSPLLTQRQPRINILMQGIRNSLDTIEKKKLNIEIEHFIGYKPYEAVQRRLEKCNGLERSAKGSIVFISRRKLIEKLTHDYQQNSEIFRVILYTYRWYFDEKEMFTLLLERFKTPVPLSLSPAEKKSFLDSVISKIQMKVLIFLKDWFKHYGHTVNSDLNLQDIFIELLYLMFTHPDLGKSVQIPVSQLLSSLEGLEERKENNISSVMKVTSLPEIFIPLPIILSYSHVIAKQLCIIDNENFSKIKVTEFYKKCWTTKNKHVHAPNLTHIGEFSTKLSKFVIYLILMNKKNMLRVILYQFFIDLCHQLLQLRNFNSALAIYLGLSNFTVQRLKTLIEPYLDKEALKIYSQLEHLFSHSNNMETLKTKQNEEQSAGFIPYLGVYQSELLFTEELSDYQNEEKQMINFTKFSQISDKINKIINFRETYDFQKVEPVINFITGIPPIHSDLLYNLSIKVLPNKE